MQNTRYFSIKSFNDYLQENVLGASLVKKQHGSSENIFLEDIQGCSFQLVETDFFANQSITQGEYTSREGVKCYWEEFRIRFRSPPVHFQEKQDIPKGKYRIRVQAEDDKKPVVKTFVRKSIGVYSWWKEKSLPSSLPLDRILNGKLEDYVLKQD